MAWARTKRQKGKEEKVGPGCLDCKRTYTSGNFDMLHNEYENFEVFCVAAVSNKSMKDLFLDAHKVRLEKSDREFDMCDVFSLESSGWLVFRSYLAFTKAEFQAEFKVSPESLGLKVRMLTNDWGARFRGILMIDPANPHLRYQHNYENSCVQNTFKMLAASNRQTGRYCLQSHCG